MSFFEPPPPPPEPPQDAPPAPEWLGPPGNVLPASFPLDLVLARTDQLALSVHSGRAYVNGFDFALALHLRDPRKGHANHPMMGWHVARHGGFEDDTLRFGITFADDRKATIFDPHPWWGDPEQRPTPDIVLSQRGGGGGGATWEFGFWAWPLPPEGPIEFVAEWPSEGVALTRVELDSAVVREAATRAVTLWPDPGPGGHGRVWTRMSK
jgi:hypothetical protein